MLKLWAGNGRKLQHAPVRDAAALAVRNTCGLRELTAEVDEMVGYVTRNSSEKAADKDFGDVVPVLIGRETGIPAVVACYLHSVLALAGQMSDKS